MYKFRPSHPLCCVCALLASFFLAGCFHAASTEPMGRSGGALSSSKLAYQKLERLRESQYAEQSLPWPEFWQNVRSAYEHSVLGQKPESEAALRAMSTENLRYHYKAAHFMAFYTGDGEYVEASRYYLDALARRGEVARKDYEDLYRSYVKARQFKKARALLDERPRMEVVPLEPVIEAMPLSGGRPSVLSFRRGSKALFHHPANLDLERQILIVGHPLCHFTRDAARALVQHPKLWHALTEHSLWLAPQGGRINANEFREWNKAIPRARMVIAYKQAEWPIIDSWDLPTFYFVRNGMLVDKVVGWPEQGHLKGIVRGMRAIGLEPEAEHKMNQKADSF